MAVSKKALDIPPFIVMDVLEKAQSLQAAGQDVIHLEVGEPDFDTPECVKQAAIRAMVNNHTHYTHSLGLIELRRAIAKFYQQQHNAQVDPEQILLTCGSSPAMLMLFAALLETDDQVILSDPCYACYPNFINFLGGKVQYVPVSESDAFQYKPQDIADKINHKTRAVVINSPANPTGQLLSAQRMRAIAELASGKNGRPYVVSDEIYHGLVYDNQPCHSILEFTPNAFVLGGFSKLYAMTGWRLGYLIAPPEFIRPLQKMQQNFAICAPSIAQHAALAVYEQANEVAAVTAAMLDEYNCRRLRMLQGLKELGFKIPVAPQGAFYMFARCDHLNANDYELAFHILENAQVALTPGRDFGPGGHSYLRLSYASSLKNIDLAFERLREYLIRFYPQVLKANQLL